MKDFFKYVLATIVGFILSQIFLIILGFIMIGLIVAAGTMGDREEEGIEPNSILHITLNHPIVERTSDNPFDRIGFTFMDMPKPESLRNIINSIRRAAEDDDIEGIYLDVGLALYPYATLQEIRNALVDFRESGKFIYAYSEYLDHKTYFLTSTADKIYMHPEGFCNWLGFSTEVMFLKGALDKLDIKPKVIRVGKFKAAVEPLLRKDMSPENEEQLRELLFSTWNHYLEQISETRGVPVELLAQAADSAKIVQPRDAVEYNLVDEEGFEDQVRILMAENLELDEVEDLELVSLPDYIDETDRDFTGDEIALVYAVGDIVMGSGDNQTIGSETLSKAIREAREDDDVKAIVLRVNSPGGSALASDVILREVKLAKAEKPVIVSMGDLAASGGYYISCFADAIVAEPNTITGSIGVFGVIPIMEEFWNNKLGITWDRVKTGPFADIGNVNREMTAQEEALIQSLITDIYTDFIVHVANGRGLDTGFVNSIAQGRVWSGIQAEELGLVDMLGGMDSAFALAARAAELEEDDYRISIYPKQEDPFQQIMKDFSGSTRQWALRTFLPEEYKVLEEIEKVKNMKGIQAKLPYRLEIN